MRTCEAGERARPGARPSCEGNLAGLLGLTVTGSLGRGLHSAPLGTVQGLWSQQVVLHV